MQAKRAESACKAFAPGTPTGGVRGASFPPAAGGKKDPQNPKPKNKKQKKKGVIVRILFVNHVFPGHLGPLAAAFAADGGHEVKFLSNHTRRDFSLPGVGHVILRSDERRAGRLTETERALAAGRQALKAFDLLRKNGFVPDLILFASGWEYGLYVRDAFPDAFTVCCSDTVPVIPKRAAGGKLLPPLLQSRLMLTCDLCLSLTAGAPTPWADRLTTAMALPYPVDTAGFARASAKPALLDGEAVPDGAEVTLFSIADCKSAQQIVRAAEQLTALRPRCHAVLLCESAARECADEIIRPLLSASSRLYLPQTLGLRDYRNLLCASGLILFDRVPPPSVLLEAMSCEVAPVLWGDMPASLLQHGENAFSCPQKSNPASFLAALWDDPDLPAVRRQARCTVLEHFRQQDVIPGHVHAIMAARERWYSRKNRPEEYCFAVF